MKALTNLRQFIAQVQAAPIHEGLSPTDKRQIVDRATSIALVISERGMAVMDDAGIGIDRPRPDPAAKVALRAALRQMQQTVAQGARLPPANPNATPPAAPPDNAGMAVPDE